MLTQALHPVWLGLSHFGENGKDSSISKCARLVENSFSSHRYIVLTQGKKKKNARFTFPMFPCTTFGKPYVISYSLFSYTLYILSLKHHIKHIVAGCEKC